MKDSQRAAIALIILSTLIMIYWVIPNDESLAVQRAARADEWSATRRKCIDDAQEKNVLAKASDLSKACSIEADAKFGYVPSKADKATNSTLAPIMYHGE